jgi:hypothetical protein
MCSQLKTSEKKQIIKLCPFPFVDLLRALESPNVQSAEDTREARILLNFAHFFCRFAALESPNLQSAEDTDEKQIFKICPFSFVDLLRALESSNVQSAEDTEKEQIIKLCPFLL